MIKIPTIFERDDKFKVIDAPRAECAWVFAGEGIATEKLDGTNCRLTVSGGRIVRVEKRRNLTKAEKQQGIVDGWYIDANESDPADKWIFAAVHGTDATAWPDGEHPVEAMGPKIQGNPLGLLHNICVPFLLRPTIYVDARRNFDGLRVFLTGLESLYSPGALAEGLVFHHPDGRMAKIKRKDFG